jgi:hypothetical protein
MSPKHAKDGKEIIMGGLQRELARMQAEQEEDQMHTVYVVMAEEPKPRGRWEAHSGRSRKCYCVCDSFSVAAAVIEKDISRGDILPGATIEEHTLQTKDMV